VSSSGKKGKQIMLDKVITNIDQVSNEWLSTVLANSGALTGGAVDSIEIGRGHGNWSTSASLQVKYTHEAQGLMPERLFLKMVDTDAGDGESFDDSEVTYYTRDYVDVKRAPLLRCYDAVYSKELNRYHILLDDVSETHIESRRKMPICMHAGGVHNGLLKLARRFTAQALFSRLSMSPPQGSSTSCGGFRMV
jgi:hypothetical protein